MQTMGPHAENGCLTRRQNAFAKRFTAAAGLCIHISRVIAWRMRGTRVVMAASSRSWTAR